MPLHDDRALFEMLTLEGAQAGLAWITILRKREGYRSAFDGFDARRVARFDPAPDRELLSDPGIVRNRGKIEGAVRERARVARRWSTEARQPRPLPLGLRGRQADPEPLVHA